MNRFGLVGLCLLFFVKSAVAQLAQYPFNADVNDQLGNYDPSNVFGTPDFSSGEYILLDSGEYIVLPNALHQAFDKTASLEFRVRFKVEGDYEATPAIDGFGEEARIILTSKEEYDQRFGGFDITARQWEGDLWIITTFGDGLIYSNGLQSEGKLDFVTRIDTDTWYDFRIKFVFDESTPYIQYIVNGVLSTSFYDERMDYEGFRQLIDQQQLVVGSTMDNNIAERDSEHPSLDLLIDYLDIYSPAPAGDPAAIGTTLQALERHMKGDENYSDTQLDSLQDVFVANWDDDSYEPNATTILSYIETYSSTQGFVFTLKNNAESPENFGPLKFIQFQMEQWILDNRYGTASVEQMEGVVFKEHERFPGSVKASAPRLSSADFTIDGGYQTDPGFYLNDQEYVRRPTGYFVPAGELVTVTVPDEAIDQGLSLYVGATRKNLQEGWTEFRRFPRTSTTFDLDAKTITIANPFGGGIYIAIPDGTQLGNLTFEVSGAVKAPYYCTKEGYENSLSDFMAEISKAEVPYVDMESDNFMCTITQGMASTMTDPDSVMTIWDESFDAVNLALGRPQKRFRSEYIIQDRQNHAQFTAAPAAYPMSLEVYNYPYEAVSQQPVDVESGTAWYNDTGTNEFHYIIFHEYGHLHNMPTLMVEQETNVHLPATAIYNLVMGESIDSAFVYAQNQRINLEEATFDWVFTPNFINGERIGPEEPYNNPWDQLLYQSRGLVKLVDIAKMFGWEALGDINAYFYQYQIDNPDWSPYALGDDQFIRVASEVLGINMAPHFEFHGIIPSDALVNELSTMPVSEVIKERILHYRFHIPANNEEFTAVYNKVAPRVDPQFHLPRWDAWKSEYDEDYAKSVIDRIDVILNKYYDLTEADLNYEPVIEGMTDEISINQNTTYQFSLDNLVVTDLDHDYPQEHSLVLEAGENYSLNGFEIIPDTDFAGTLSIGAKVSDGIEESALYTVEITVISDAEANEEPVINGLTRELSTNQNESITITLADLDVTDPDHTYPDDHTLTVKTGDNYTLEGTTVTPTQDFSGTLMVPLVVSDGIEESEEYTAEIRVISDEERNAEPVIDGLNTSFAIAKGESLTITLSDLNVTDEDHDYPNDHTLMVNAGANYTVDGNTVTPAQDFIGTLTVPLVVSDGIENSEPFNANVEVSPVLSTDPFEAGVRIYPNPTWDGLVNVEGVPAGSKYNLRDLRGRQVQSGIIESGSIQIKGGSGVYLLEVVSVTGARLTQVIYRY